MCGLCGVYVEFAHASEPQDAGAGEFHAQFQRAACGLDEPAQRREIEVGLALDLDDGRLLHPKALGDLLLAARGKLAERLQPLNLGVQLGYGDRVTVTRVKVTVHLTKFDIRLRACQPCSVIRKIEHSGHCHRNYHSALGLERPISVDRAHMVYFWDKCRVEDGLRIQMLGVRLTD